MCEPRIRERTLTILMTFARIENIKICDKGGIRYGIVSQLAYFRFSFAVNPFPHTHTNSNDQFDVDQFPNSSASHGTIPTRSFLMFSLLFWSHFWVRNEPTMNVLTQQIFVWIGQTQTKSARREWDQGQRSCGNWKCHGHGAESCMVHGDGIALNTGHEAHRHTHARACCRPRTPFSSFL